MTDPRNQGLMPEWGSRHYGAVFTALSNNVQFWKDAEQSATEDWARDMARSQVVSYSTALEEFEQLFG